jgi:hypothetical protein
VHAEYAGGSASDNADRSALGVTAEERALRALEDFDPLDVEQGGVEALCFSECNAVQVDTDAVVTGSLVLVVRNDPADADRQRRLARLERRNAKAGDRAIGEVEQALDVAILKRLGVRNADRDRRLLKVRLALAVTMMLPRPWSDAA